MDGLNDLIAQVQTKLENIRQSINTINNSADSLILKAKSMEGRQDIDSALRTKQEIENMLATIEAVSHNKLFETNNLSPAVTDNHKETVDESVASNRFEEVTSQQINALEKDCLMLNVINEGIQTAMTATGIAVDNDSD